MNPFTCILASIGTGVAIHYLMPNANCWLVGAVLFFAMVFYLLSPKAFFAFLGILLMVINVIGFGFIFLVLILSVMGGKKNHRG